METLHTCLPQRQVLLLKSSISKPTGHTTQDWCDDLQNYRQQPLSRKSFLLTLGSKNFNLFFLRSDAFWGSKFRGNMAGNDCWIFHEIASLRNWFHSAKLGCAKSTLCHQREKSEYFTLKRHANFMRANLLANVSASGMICPWLYCIWNTNVLTVWKIIPTIGITIVTLSCY